MENIAIKQKFQIAKVSNGSYTKIILHTSEKVSNALRLANTPKTSFFARDFTNFPIVKNTFDFYEYDGVTLDSFLEMESIKMALLLE